MFSNPHTLTHSWAITGPELKYFLIYTEDDSIYNTANQLLNKEVKEGYIG